MKTRNRDKTRNGNPHRAAKLDKRKRRDAEMLAMALGTTAM